MKVAVTGNIGTGKSTATRVFEWEGFTVVNSDLIGHELYRRDDVGEKIVGIFGSDILTRGHIDRRKLKNIVFYDYEKLKQLNAVMHPEILKEVRKLTSGNGNYVIEGALLVEAGFKDYDILVVVTIDREEQIKRLMKKGKYTEEEIENIIASQMPQEDKIEKADYVIDNSGSLEEFKENVKKIVKEIKKEI